MIDWILGNKQFLAVLSALGGVLLTVFTQQLLNRRGRFRYSVLHNRVGISTDDAIFGSVKVTWNGNFVPNLFLSTVELTNESMRDFENVVIKVFSNDTLLLSEATEIVGTTHILKWTDEFAAQTQVMPGQQPTQKQFELYYGQRSYLLPVANRGQLIRLSFLNAPKTNNQPSIWLDVLHRGVKLEYGIRHNQTLGIPQPTAGWIGLIIGIFLVVTICSIFYSVWLCSVISFGYGLFAQIFGALAVKVWRKLQNLFGG